MPRDDDIGEGGDPPHALHGEGKVDVQRRGLPLGVVRPERYGVAGYRDGIHAPHEDRHGPRRVAWGVDQFHSGDDLPVLLHYYSTRDRRLPGVDVDLRVREQSKVAGVVRVSMCQHYDFHILRATSLDVPEGILERGPHEGCAGVHQYLLSPGGHQGRSGERRLRVHGAVGPTLQAADEKDVYPVHASPWAFGKKTVMFATG